MAVERVEIAGEEAPPDAPTEDGQVEQQVEESQEQPPTEARERPSWLPEKFANEEALAKAYGELEKKLSSAKAEEQGLLTASDFEKYESEYLDNEGKLNDASYDELAKKGISRDLVDKFIEGQERLSQEATAELFNLAGGEDNYGNMMAWAQENLSEDEMDAYDEAVSGKNANMAKLAIQGLHSAYLASGAQPPTTPNLVQGGKAAGIKPYGSTYEMLEEMKNPLYKNGDKAYHKYVEDRIAIS